MGTMPLTEGTNTDDGEMAWGSDTGRFTKGHYDTDIRVLTLGHNTRSGKWHRDTNTRALTGGTQHLRTDLWLLTMVTDTGILTQEHGYGHTEIRA